MMDGMTAKQFMDWQAFAALEPFDESWMDRRFALLAQIMANLWTDSKNGRRYTTDDFMLRKPITSSAATQKPKKIPLKLQRNMVLAAFGVSPQMLKEKAKEQGVTIPWLKD